MAKAVHWTVSFRSLKNIPYRVDIYDEGYSGSPVQLPGAREVFTTAEDASEDFFAPIRPQSGSLRLIDTDGTLLEQLIPANATARPVRLVNVNNDSVVWQGFLSPESYTQGYTSVTQELELPLISSLRAMCAEELTTLASMQFTSILAHFAHCLSSFNVKVDISGWFGNIYFPTRYFAVMRDKKVFQNFAWSAEELTNQETVTVDVHSESINEVLSRICSFFGCVLRESGRNLYMTDVQCYGGAREYTYTSYINLVAALVDQLTPLSVSTTSYSTDLQMSAMEWRGADHTKTIIQGARRVYVRASLEDFECDMNLPETPYGYLVQGTLFNRVWANTADDCYSLSTYKYIRVGFMVPNSQSGECTLSVFTYASTNSYNMTCFWLMDDVNEFRTHWENLVSGVQYGIFRPYITAYLSIYRDAENVDHKGLMVCGFPKYLRIGDSQYRAFSRFALTADNALYTQQTPMTFAANQGWLNINAKVDFFNCINNNNGTGVYAGANVNLTFALQFGTKWWNGSAWTTSFATFTIPVSHDGITVTNKTDDMDTKEGSGFFIPITEYMKGKVTLKVYHEMEGYYYDILDQFWFPLSEVLFSQLDVTYVAPDKVELSDRKQNSYIAAMDNGFSDKIEMNLHLATDLYNDIHSNLLWDSDTETTKLITLDNQQVRAEADLLDRAKDYYNASRRKLSLETNRPNVPLPAAQYAGFDGKKYLPLAESRDWAQDKSTLTCFETVNNA